MRQEQQIKHLTVWNCLLFFLVTTGFEMFAIITANLYGATRLILVGEMLLIAFLAFLSLEIFLVFKFDPKDKKNFLTPFLLTHAPWLIAPALGALPHIHLPAPHDLLLRKFQIFFGLMWVTHLFLFTRFFLDRTYKKSGEYSKIFGLAAAFLFCGTTLTTATFCDLSGDEPHYLLMAQSLLHDGDLDLSNNYADRDYSSFYHRGELEPQGLEHVVNGKRVSHHPLGPVLLILPGFALFGRLGAALTMALLAALALYWTLKALEGTGAKGWPLHVTGLIGLASSPLFLFSGLIFPEVPTACLTALSLYLFGKKRWFGLGLAQGLLLWMHNRNALLVIPFLFFFIWEIWKEKKRRNDLLGRFALGFAIPVALLALYFYSLYGVLTPLGAHNESFTSLFRLDHFFIGFFGLIFDQECGFCFHYPVFALMVSGAALLFRFRHPFRFPAAGTAAFYFLAMCFYENLGLTPAARYFVGITPLLLVVIYPMLEKTKVPSFGYYTTMFAFVSGVVVNWVLAVVPWMRYNKLNGENMMLKVAGDLLRIPLTAGAPSFQTPVIQWQSYAVSLFWLVLTFVLSVLFLRKQTKNSLKG